MRAVLAAALLCLIVGATAAPLAALSQGGSTASAYVKVAMDDAALASAYGVNSSEVEHLASMAYIAYQEGNYSGAEELALEAMRLAYILLASAEPSQAPANVSLLGLLMAELGAAERSPWLGPNASAAAEYALRGLALLGAGNLSGAYYFAGRALALLQVSGQLSAMAGFKGGLALLASAEARDGQYLAGNLSRDLGPLANSTVVEDGVNAVLSAVAGLNNGTPAGLVSSVKAALELSALAQNISPSYNMSFRLSVAEEVLNMSSEALGYLGLASSYLARLNLSISQATQDLGNASASMTCASDALASYSVLNVSEAYLDVPCVDERASMMPNASLAGGLQEELEGLSSAISALLNASSLLTGASEVPEAYSNLSYAAQLTSEAASYVAKALQEISEAAQPSGYLSQAQATASLAYSTTVQVNSTQAKAFVNSTVSAVANASAYVWRLAESIREDLPSALVLTSIARPVNVSGQELALNLTSHGLMNTSEAIMFYSQSEDQQALNALAASKAYLSEAESVVQALNSSSKVSYVVADLVYGLATNVISLDQLIQGGITEYPTPPSSYVPDMVEAAEGVANASLSLRYDSLAVAALAAGNASGFLEYSELSNTTLWSSLRLASSLKQLLSRSPLVEQASMQALSDVAALCSWTAASGLASLGASAMSSLLTTGSNESEAAYYLGESIRAEGALGAEINVTGQPPSVPPYVNDTLFNGTVGLEASLAVTAGAVASIRGAEGSLSWLSSEAGLVTEALGNLTDAAYASSAALYYASTGDWAAANATLARASSYASSLAVMIGKGGATGYIAGLSGPLERVINDTRLVGAGAEALSLRISEAEHAAAELESALSSLSRAEAYESLSAQLLASGWPSNASRCLNVSYAALSDAYSALELPLVGGLWPSGASLNASFVSYELLNRSYALLAGSMRALRVSEVSLEGSLTLAVGAGWELLAVQVEGSEMLAVLYDSGGSAFAYLVSEEGPLLVLSPAA